MKPFKILPRLFAIFGLLMMFAVSGLSDTEPNDSCTEQELISELNGISTTTSHTESGGTSSSDIPDYYYFKPGVAGTLDLHFTTTGGTVRLFVSTSTCGSDEIGPGSAGHTDYTGSFDVAATETVYIRVQRNQTRTYNLAMTFTPAGTPPTFTGTIPAQSATQNSAYSLNTSTYFTQTEGDTITYSTSGTLPTGITINSSTGVLSGTPTNFGTFSGITIVATDNDGARNSNSFTLTVAQAQVAPTFSGTIPNQTADIGSAYSLDASTYFTQTNSDTITYTSSGSLPAGVTLNSSTGVLSGTPTVIGTYSNIIIIATDNDGATSSNSFSITVGCNASFDASDAADSAPGTIITSMHNITTSTTTCISGSSPNNDSDYYYFTVNTDGILNITASPLNAHDYHLKVGSSSGGNQYYADTTAQNHTVPQITLSAGDSVYIYVKETGNDTDNYQLNFTFALGAQTPPTFSGTIPNQTANTGSAFSLNASTYFAQTNNDTITYTKTGTLPAGITLNATTGILSGTPTVAGAYSNIIIIATDDDGATSSNSFSITIVVAPIAATTQDMCYDSLTYSEMFCMNFGGFQGGIGCTQTIPLRNISGVALTSVNAVLDTSGFSGSFFGSCGVDGTSGSCQQSSNINMGPIGIFNTGVSYTLPNYGSTDSHSIYESSLMSMSIFSGNNLYATYTKNTTAYVATIASCPVLSPDLNISKTASVSSTTVGTDYTYTIRVGNQGSALAANATVSDTLPTGVTYKSYSGSGWSCSGTTTLSCTYGALANGAIASDLVITVTAPSSAMTITANSAIVSTTTAESSTANNTATSGTVAVTASVVVTKPDGQCGVFPSVLSTYYHITSSGNNDQACYTGSITYPLNEITGSIVCNNAGCGGSTSCQRLDPPADRYSITFPSLLTTTTTISSNKTFVPTQIYSGSTSNDYNTSANVVVTGGTTLTFAPGDYYFKSLKFMDNNPYIVLSSGGRVRLFIEDNFTVEKNGLNVNKNGIPDNLFVYVGGNMDFKTNGNVEELKGYFYVKGSALFDANSNNFKVTGGITSEGTINIAGNNGDFIQSGDSSGLGYGDCNVKVGFDRQVYQISEDTALAYDASSLVSLTVKLSHAVSYPVTVSYRTYDGTSGNPVNNAIATSSGGTDYYSQNSSLTFAIGETSKTIQIAIIHDEPIEPDENFTVVLTNPQPSATVLLDTNSTATVTILGQTTAPVCYSDNFNTGTAATNNWRVLSNVGFTPGYANNRMRLTDNATHRATAITKDYQFRASQNLIIAEFTHYAYGGSGADGMGLVLYDSAIGATPNVGVTGGSLGYAQGSNAYTACQPNGCPGFQGGWLGLGIDEYGNYSNPNEGRTGTGLNSGFHADAVSIRGKGDSSTGYMSGYTYLAGTGTLTPSIDASVSTPNKYKMVVDARDPAHLYITLYRDTTGTGTAYGLPVIDRFDAIASQGSSPYFVRLALTGSTGGSTNFHEIDDLTVSGICVPYTTETTTGVFDAWDTSRSVSDRNISTKIASQNFNLTVASLNSANNGVQAKVLGRGAYYRLWDSTANTNRTPYVFFDANVSTGMIQPAFNLFTATKDMKVQFKFCADYNGTAYDVKEDIACTSQNICHPTLVTTNTPCYREKFSTDNFAIRPDHFEFSAPIAKMRSGEDYNLAVDAKDYSGANTQEYNQSISSLTKAISTWWQRDSNTQLNTITYPVHGSIVATAGDWNLSNGTGSVPIQFSDVGKFTLDLNDTNWAAVDIDDTALSLRTIHGEGNVTFVPYDFNITAATITNNKGVFPSFTYLSNDLNMSARIPMSVSAKNKQHVTTQNYANNMYERNITITPLVSSVAASTAGLTPLILGISNVDANFSAGTKSIAYNDTIVSKFNFNRNQTQAISPFDINSSNGVGNDVNLTIIDTDSVYGDRNQTLDGNATFIYGRIIPRDIRVFGNAAFSANAWYEVYNAPTLAGQALSPSRNDALWYINKLHNETTDNNATVTQVSAGNLPTSQDYNTTTGIKSYNFGGQATLPFSAKAHINTESWLWYGQTALGYEDPTGTNSCLTHPCFNINIVPPIGASGSAKDSTTSATKTSKQTTKPTGLIYDYAPAIR